MVTNTTMCVKDIVLTVGKAAWKHHAARAREVTSAADVLLFNIQAAGHKGWAEEPMEPGALAALAGGLLLA